ncbi:MAG TPA: type II toxin-antitoxin system Phd/YefM family antitoxin [Clostridiaceae bacterium]|jgi:antitoxin YefM|nr:type II toxin-antitoxin system Phd/YefM family antitoxin [Clostridiaceae bacterium]
MIHTNITNFRKNLFELINQTIKYGEPVNVITKDGNAIVLSEDDYNGLLETLELLSTPGMKEKIVEGMNTPIDECLEESEVQW